MSNKLQEALDHIKAAEKYLKTSLLKWSPDYDSAAEEYIQAARCYRIIQNGKKTKECHMLASNCHKKNNAFFHAAKCIENAIIAAKEILAPLEIYEMAEEACDLYQQHGSADSGAHVLDKASKIIEERAPERALYLIKRAADVTEGETTSHQAAEFMSRAARLMVRLRMYDDAVEAVLREIGYHQKQGTNGSIGRLCVVLVLLHLARGDSVSAEKAFREWGGYCELAEQQNLEAMLEAFDEEDTQAAARALKDPFIRHMDVEYAKLATLIPLPGRFPCESKLVDISPEMPTGNEPLATSTPEMKPAGKAKPDQPPTVEDDDDDLC